MSNRIDSGLKYVNAPSQAGASLDDCFQDEVVPVHLIFCPFPAYGRPIRPDHVKTLTEGHPFDMAKTRIAVSMRADGRYACVDGNHTVERARMEGYGLVRARVYIDKSIQEEADLFVAFDKQRRITAVQHFMTSIASEDETAMRVLRIVRDHGYEISARNSDGNISAVTALLWIHDTYGATLLADTLRLIKSAFGLERAALKAEAIKGVASFWRRYAAMIDRDRLVRLMSDTGPRRMLQNAAQHHATHPRDSKDIAYGKQLLELYDRGLHARNKLPEWKSRAYSDATLADMPLRAQRSLASRRAKGEDISATVKRGIETRRAKGEDLSATVKAAYARKKAGKS